MLDVVEADVQAGKVRQVFEALDVGYLIIVEVQLDEGGTEIVGDMDSGYLVLPQTESLQHRISRLASTQVLWSCDRSSRRRRRVYTSRRVNLSNRSARRDFIREWTRSTS
jgi:glycosyltransferase involved in cell wall biosynthesis